MVDDNLGTFSPASPLRYILPFEMQFKAFFKHFNLLVLYRHTIHTAYARYTIQTKQFPYSPSQVNSKIKLTSLLLIHAQLLPIPLL